MKTPNIKLLKWTDTISTEKDYDYWDDYKDWLKQLKEGDKHKGERNND